MNIILKLVDIISSFFEVFIIMEVITKLYKSKRNNSTFGLLFSLFLLVTSTGILLLNIFIPLIEITVIFSFIIILIFSALSLNGKVFYKAISLMIIYLLLLAVDIIIIQLLSRIFKVETLNIIQGQGFRIIAIILSKFLFFILSRLFLFIKNKELNNYNRGYWWISGAISIFTIAVILVAMYLQTNYNYPVYDIFFVFTIIILFLVNIAVYYMILKISEDSIIINKSNLINQQNNIMINHYKEIENANTKLNHLRHNYNNHLAYMEKCLKDERLDLLKEYINQIKSESVFKSDFPKTGNYAIDTILEFKLPLAIEKGINFIIVGAAPKDIKINDYDLCCILTNILDNAIESCEALGNGDEKFIKCKFSVYKQQYLNIEIINPVSSYNKDFSTKKANKELHGIGLESARIAADKNNGLSHFVVEEGFFHSKIMINL